MGKFLTALHVKTTGKEQFIEKFTQLMKKDGYVPCSEDEAAVSGGSSGLEIVISFMLSGVISRDTLIIAKRIKFSRVSRIV